MVCPRCIRVVQAELEKLGLEVLQIRLGHVELASEPADLKTVAEALEKQGFALLEERNARLVNELKVFVQEQIRSGNLETGVQKFSVVIEDHFSKTYAYLSQLFSQSENQTLEHYIIAQKIEQTKEWLVYDELTLSEMAFRLGYSSVSHLSYQFRKTTGFSPSEFKALKGHHRHLLTDL